MLSHLKTRGRKPLPEWLNQARLVVFNEIEHSVVDSVVSIDQKLPRYALVDQEVSTPISASATSKRDVEVSLQSLVIFHVRPIAKHLQTGRDSLVGQNVTDGFIAEADQETTQFFFTQDFFGIPEKAEESLGHKISVIPSSLI